MGKTACLITGGPGVGKTTLVRQAVAAFSGRAGGFYTEEIRHGGVRQGFRLVALDGTQATLAHISIPGPPRVGKYGVDMAALEEVGVASLDRAVAGGDLVVIDEIGRMELFSAAFRESVRQAVEGGHRVLGTVMQAPHPFADAIKAHPRVRLLSLSRATYPQVLQEVLGWLQS
jgi:nucleoside-triphosphatase